MLEASTLENVHIYLNNVSTYYIFSIVISLLSVFVTIYYKFRLCVPMEEETDSTPIQFKASEVPLEEDTDDNLKNAETTEEPEMDSVLSNMSPVMIKQFLKAQVPLKLLTEDQLTEERRAEKAQLEAIFKLLQEQESKFQMNSMEDLHEQMRLYGM